MIVNGYDLMSRGLLQVQAMYTKPIVATAGYQAYMRYKFDVTTGYAALVSTVINEKIVFTSDEPGYPFYWNTVAKAAPNAKNATN